MILLKTLQQLELKLSEASTGPAKILVLSMTSSLPYSLCPTLTTPLTNLLFSELAIDTPSLGPLPVLWPFSQTKWRLLQWLSVAPEMNSLSEMQQVKTIPIYFPIVLQVRVWQHMARAFHSYIECSPTRIHVHSNQQCVQECLELY